MYPIFWKYALLGNLSGLFYLNIPSKNGKKMSKGTNFMCDGISGGGAKWFVALLPEVGKIDTRLTVAESPHNQGR